jgi:broad specificity phosphatase PhoE
MDKTTTWQEDQTWYAAPRDYHPDAPVGEGETEEDAISDLRHKIDALVQANREAVEARHDEP